MADIFVSYEIYTIEKFLLFCKNSIDKNLPVCWIQGEISNLKKMPSGHWYFSIKDKNSQVNGVFFRLQQYRLRFDLENGLEILARVRATLYAPRGTFQVVIEQIEPVGLGGLQLEFEQLKNKLQKQGWFDTNKKKNLPSYPKNIGIITSEKGAVISDIIKIIERRYPLVHLFLFNTVVQGEYAPSKVAYAIEFSDSKKLDVIIVARGGGSIEDLWAFNSHIVASAIFNAKTPIISAIGHESDVTIADFVADVRAATPSAAAELVVPDIKKQVLEKINFLQAQNKQLIINLIGKYNNNLIQTYQKLIHPKILLEQFLLRFEKILSQLVFLINNIILKHIQKLETLFYILKNNSPQKKISEKQQFNIFLIKQLQLAMQNIIHSNEQKQTNYYNSLQQLNPLSILDRGYSLSFSEKGKLIQSISNISINDIIKTHVKDGVIYSKIKKIDDKNK